MKILAKRGYDVFCPNQTFISDSESYMLLHKELDHSGVRVRASFDTKNKRF